jgi:two-component system, response regulator
MRTLTEILVADDSDQDAELTLVSLRKVLPNATALRVRDGEQVLQFLFATGGYAGRPPGLPRLLLLDLWMPGKDGLSVLEALRAHPSTRELPVVLLSSCSNPLLIERSLALGANEYQVKPTDFDSYCAVVESIVSRWCLSTPTPCQSAESVA